MNRRLGRAFLRLRFLLRQRHRHDSLVLEEDFGFPLLLLPGVFNPTLFLTTGVLIRHLEQHPLPAGCSVLDVGTGSGALAVAAARTAGRVVAVDLNPEAVRCAQINLLVNRVDDRSEIRRGSLFEPVDGEVFDRVLCNPPYYRGIPKTELERAFFSDDFAEGFAASLPAHLAPGGRALVVLSSDGDESGFSNAFDAESLGAEVVAETQVYGEPIRIYELSVRDRALSELP